MAKSLTQSIIVRNLLLALVYFFTAKYGLIYALYHFATIIWPPSGFAVAAVLMCGYRLVPGIFLGAFAINYYTGAPFFVACGIATGNTMEAVIAGYCCSQLVDFNKNLERKRDVLQFILYTAILSPFVASFVGVSSLYLGQILTNEQVLVTWLQWWAGDCIGILTITPLLLVVRPPRWSEITWKRSAEAVLLSVSMFVVLSIVFTGLFGIGQRIKGPFIFPFMLWASIRFGVRGAILATLMASSIAVWAISHGIGPFASGSPVDQAIQVSIYVFSVAAMDLILASVVAQLQRGERDLTMALGTRDLFFSMASHELKTPITALKLQFQMLERDLREKVPSRQELVEIVDSSLRQIGGLQDLVDDLLDVSRIRAGRFNLHCETLDLSAVAEQICGRFAGQLERAGFELRLQLNANVMGFWDRRRLEQVLINLLSNAIKYAQPGVLVVRVFAREAEAVMVIEDIGPGIPPHLQKRIFDRFERLNVKNAADGLGLGLYIVKEIVHAHKGSVGLTSAVGHGSQFSIKLPIQTV